MIAVRAMSHCRSWRIFFSVPNGSAEDVMKDVEKYMVEHGLPMNEFTFTLTEEE